MNWLQLSFITSQSQSKQIAHVLEQYDALSTSYSGHVDIFEEKPGMMPNWEDVKITALFAATVDLASLWLSLSKLLDIDSLASLKISRLADKKWERVWMDQFQPMHFGNRLWIVPTGFTAPDPLANNINLDPGLAFGSGTHATTALCLEWLAGHPPVGLNVIDYGAGSGILALVAAKLGAAQVYALDIDKRAIEASKDNAQKNNLTIKTLLIDEDHAPVLSPSDLIFANILAKPLLRLVTVFDSLLKEDGVLVLSGILSSQIEDILQVYKEHFAVEEVAERERWVRIVVRKMT